MEEKTVYCSNCGKKLNDGEKFCSSCGKKNNVETSKMDINNAAIAGEKKAGKKAVSGKVIAVMLSGTLAIGGSIYIAKNYDEKKEHVKQDTAKEKDSAVKEKENIKELKPEGVKEIEPFLVTMENREINKTSDSGYTIIRKVQTFSVSDENKKEYPKSAEAVEKLNVYTNKVFEEGETEFIEEDEMALQSITEESIIDRCDETIFSVCTESRIFPRGAAHGWSSVRCANINVKTGDIVRLEEIIDDKDAFAYMIDLALQEKYPELKEYKSPEIPLVDASTIFINYEEMGGAVYTLSNTGLTMYFQQQSVPGSFPAQGILSVSLPYTTLGDNIAAWIR